MLSVGQLWSYERLQKTQLEMAAVTENSDSDKQWTFGQIVAVSVFAPALIDFLFACLSQRKAQKADTGPQDGEGKSINSSKPQTQQSNSKPVTDNQPERGLSLTDANESGHQPELWSNIGSKDFANGVFNRRYTK
jgi:hypothetical protein